jgi:hypothetical protein
MDEVFNGIGNDIPVMGPGALLTNAGETLHVKTEIQNLLFQLRQIF